MLFETPEFPCMKDIKTHGAKTNIFVTSTEYTNPSVINDHVLYALSDYSVTKSSDLSVICSCQGIRAILHLKLSATTNGRGD